MGRIFEIGTAAEYYQREIILCARDVMVCEIDLQQSQECLNRCDNGGTEHWAVCVKMDREELRKSRERLEMLKKEFGKANNGGYVIRREQCEDRD